MKHRVFIENITLFLNETLTSSRTQILNIYTKHVLEQIHIHWVTTHNTFWEKIGCNVILHWVNSRRWTKIFTFICHCFNDFWCVMVEYFLICVIFIALNWPLCSPLNAELIVSASHLFEHWMIDVIQNRLFLFSKSICKQIHQKPIELTANGLKRNRQKR